MLRWDTIAKDRDWIKNFCSSQMTHFAIQPITIIVLSVVREYPSVLVVRDFGHLISVEIGY